MVGILPECFGGHYIQRGADNYVATWCTVSPPMTLIFIRVNCTIGGLNNGSIKHKIAGGRFFGRCVSGIPILLKKFYVSLPYLYFSTCSSDSER